MLSKGVSSSIFWVFGMTQLGIKNPVLRAIGKHSIYKVIYMYIHVCICMCLTKPSTICRMQHKVNFLTKYSWFKFSVRSSNKAKVPGLTNYQPIARGRTNRFMFFPKAFTHKVKCKQPHPGFWTLVTNHISYEDNDYTKYTYVYMYLCVGKLL